MSDEVSNFLRSVEQLKDRRLEEDEARSRELEEKILQEKRERQARREERARSISPQKSSPANTPPPSSSHHRYNSSQSDVLKPASPYNSPSSRSNNRPGGSALESSSDAMGTPSSSSTKENESPFDADGKASATFGAGRTPTLSWQRRPTSLSVSASDRPKIRPLSMVAAENAAARSSVVSVGSPGITSVGGESAEPDAEPDVSRDQIAHALSSKDPSWFRQTADRGLNSAAYRRTQVEDNDRQDMTAAPTQLPGMVRAPSTEPEPAPQSPSTSSFSALQAGTIPTGTVSPMTPTQKLDPPVDSLSSPPASGWSTPTRPRSPTKGAGGFVQSAMMKRSDSVKRWSVTSPPSLQRVDNVASVRPEGGRRTGPQPATTSRPTSRDGRASPTKAQASNNTASASAPAPAEEEHVDAGHEDEEKTSSLPVSPSKTMDPRRWSPNKTSSWLEAALNKPDLPKPKMAASLNNQPAWMVELSKQKAQKAGSTTGSEIATPPTPVTHKHEVKTGGLMRSSPMGATAAAAALKPSVPLPISVPVPGRSGRGGFHTHSASVSSITGKSGIELPLAPTTPTSLDFRTNLKPRQPLPTDTKKDDGNENELQSVFGSLRRAKTQNFKAPDILKDNILRGKKSLNFTGGPKPREKKDEFKDAILQKKAEFQQAKSEGRGIMANALDHDDEPVLPEGLAKRLEMSRTGSKSISPTRRNRATSEVNPGADARRAEAGVFGRTSRALTVSKRETGNTASVSAEQESTTPSTRDSGILRGGPQLGGGSALANRFNSSLAGMLARGPPGAAPGASTASSGPSSSAAEAPQGPGPQLTHMTKGRARGPKRKAPSSLQQSKSAEEPAKTEDNPQRLSPPPIMPKKIETGTKPSPLVDLTKKMGPEPTVAGRSSVLPLVDSFRKRAESTTPLPMGAAIPPLESPRVGGRPRSPTKIHEQIAAIAARGAQAIPAEETVTSPVSSPRKLDVKRMSKFLQEVPSPNAAPAVEVPRPLSPSKTGGPRPLPQPRALSPQKTGGYVRPLPPAPVSPEVAAPQHSIAPASIPAFSPRQQNKLESPGPEKRAESPIPAPLSMRPLSVSPRPSTTPPPLLSPYRSAAKQAQEVSGMLKDFFGPDRSRRTYRADVGGLLSRRPAGEAKVNSISSQLFRVSSDGRKQPVPALYERVLFEGEMYLCPHTFVDERGVEARALGGKLVELRQGKETAEFLQALGGVVTFRRETSSKYDQLAPSMLCGRRFLGQIVFDEVDFATTSLCSGFPFLITQQGDCYLWKGKGSHVDELSCARLIGMDLALKGELIEVEDGQEAEEFWTLFGGSGSKVGSADHWRLKPKYDGYCGRLFRSDAGSRDQVVEVHSFDQRDLSAGGIYVLDAFFEMYIIVGYQSQGQYASFRNALDFAQEYAILAAGVEDRPFVPISTVVLEGIPRDLKSVFRKWRDDASPTRTTETVGAVQQVAIKRSRSLRVVPLTVALQALAD
ncbi:gelsolin domain containing protein [Grosmannia clavigera kw1407]|uniref:Gelsolin domain containing protein n=1 Tax=Grosmannia clavigera (strain kw1407 / UAMH 11150) TaxID=655863 RepID=F0XQA5_GROCL|nr:gelsolin domain containing protein [Grosmannia clavigera kw1407]EFX00662.1 gelsolin domain containing protein [Grosmannia clavigera kw1407]